MGNAVLERLYAQRSEQEDFIQHLLDESEKDKRDLVEAELKNISEARNRMSELDAQIEPLEAFEKTRAVHQSRRPAAQARPAAGGQGEGRQLSVQAQPRDQAYPTPGAFLADYMRAIGVPGQSGPDRAAQERTSAALGRDVLTVNRAANDVGAGEHQTTADTPGLLPSPIVGAILNDLDAARPFVSSIGVLPLEGIFGKTFERPHIISHTTVQEQTAEKGELITGDLKVEGISFTKKTFGGDVNISRQELDWTSPSAWDALVKDLEDVYGVSTEKWAAQNFSTAITQSQEVGADTLEGWVAGLYRAATKAMTAGGTKDASSLRLVNTIWTSVDMWASLGTLLTLANVQRVSNQSPGVSSMTGFEGSILDVPRIMVPGLPNGTVIMGRKNLAEFYEQRLGLLQAVEPKVLGVNVAYGGYAAFGVLDPTAFCKLSLSGSEG